jgi:hypothetical protein
MHPHHSYSFNFAILERAGIRHARLFLDVIVSHLIITILFLGHPPYNHQNPYVSAYTSSDCLTYYSSSNNDKILSVSLPSSVVPSSTTDYCICLTTTIYTKPVFFFVPLQTSVVVPSIKASEHARMHTPTLILPVTLHITRFCLLFDDLHTQPSKSLSTITLVSLLGIHMIT